MDRGKSAPLGAEGEISIDSDMNRYRSLRESRKSLIRADLAVEYGVAGAALLDVLGGVFHVAISSDQPIRSDDRIWAYINAAQIQESYLPQWSVRRIQQVLALLVRRGVLRVTSRTMLQGGATLRSLPSRVQFYAFDDEARWFEELNVGKRRKAAPKPPKLHKAKCIALQSESHCASSTPLRNLSEPTPPNQESARACEELDQFKAIPTEQTDAVLEAFAWGFEDASYVRPDLSEKDRIPAAKAIRALGGDVEAARLAAFAFGLSDKPYYVREGHRLSLLAEDASELHRLALRKRIVVSPPRPTYEAYMAQRGLA